MLTILFTLPPDGDMAFWSPRPALHTNPFSGQGLSPCDTSLFSYIQRLLFDLLPWLGYAKSSTVRLPSYSAKGPMVLVVYIVTAQAAFTPQVSLLVPLCCESGLLHESLTC